MSSYYREQLERYLGTLEIKANSVLDIGGAQLPVSKRCASWNVDEYDILDLPEPHEVRAKTTIKGDIQENLEMNKKYDMVFCLEVAEYLYDPMSAMININGLLKKDGILYITFPFIYPHHNPQGLDYLRYTQWGVEKLLSETGFMIEEMVVRRAREISFKGLWLFFIKEKMRPSKHFDGHNAMGYIIKSIKK